VGFQPLPRGVQLGGGGGPTFVKLVPGFEPIAGQLPEWAQAAAIVLAVNWLLAMIPIFAHLWFLYCLVWLVAGFAVVAWIARKLNWKPVPAWFVTSPLRLLCSCR